MFYETKTPGAHGLKHNPFKQLVVPRPIGWVSTVNKDGQPNLAPFSFFNAVADSPPMVMFAVNGGHIDGTYKDTLENVMATGEFVVNLATWELREEMNASSAGAHRNVDEFDLAKLQKAPSKLVKPPRVAASPAALECKFHTAVMLPTTSATSRNTTVFGHVVGVHIREDLIADGRVDIAKVQPIARLGYMDYAVVQPVDVFTMERPD